MLPQGNKASFHSHFLYLRLAKCIVKESLPMIGVLPVNRTIKNNKFLYRQPNYGWRYFYATFIY